jgi:5'-phosphate synthase pdxT subunit
VDSFEADLKVAVLGKQSFHAVFIRAPWIERVGEGVEVLAQLEPALSVVEGDGAIVAARQGNLLATAFHPELTDDGRFHRYFLSLRSSQQ